MDMNDNEIINDKVKHELEKISEVSSINAAQALSKMINSDVKVNFLTLTMKPSDELKSLSDDMLLSACEITGDMSGSILMAFMRENGLSLIDMLMYQNIGTQKEINEDAIGVITELTNVVGGAYLSSLANRLSCRIFPSPPIFFSDMKDFNDKIQLKIQDDTGNIFLIKTVMVINSINLESNFYFMLNRESLDGMLKVLNEG
ncbi:chemotaxis protein CheX [Candidatus Woesearchaeota archaeon]|nr:chemotaxis protein CheX [Candidatus Woesearchaeota archaeon]